MKTLERLVRAKERIAKGWIQGQYAVDAQKSSVGSGDVEAVQWCLLGALGYGALESFPEEERWDTTSPIQECAEQTPQGAIARDYGLAQWNDTPGRTKEEVLAVLDCAIDKVTKEGK